MKIFELLALGTVFAEGKFFGGVFFDGIFYIFFGVEFEGCDDGEVDMGNGICADAELAPVIQEYVAEIEAEESEAPSNGIQARRFQMGNTGTEVGMNSIDNLRTKRRTQRLTLLATKVQGTRTGAKLRPREFLKMMNSYGKYQMLS